VEYAGDLLKSLELDGEIELVDIVRINGGKSGGSGGADGNSVSGGSSGIEGSGESGGSGGADGNSVSGGGGGIEGGGESSGSGGADGGGENSANKPSAFARKDDADSYKALQAKIKLTSYKYRKGAKKPGAAGDRARPGPAAPLYGEEPDSSRRDLYNRADLCVYYSENRFFPYIAAEAAAAGTPLVTNDLSFPDRDIRDGHISFTDPIALAQKVLAFIYDKNRRDGLAGAELDFLRSRHDMEDMLIGVYDVYVRGLRI